MSKQIPAERNQDDDTNHIGQRGKEHIYDHPIIDSLLYLTR